MDVASQQIKSPGFGDIGKEPERCIDDALGLNPDVVIPPAPERDTIAVVELQVVFGNGGALVLACLVVVHAYADDGVL